MITDVADAPVIWLVGVYHRCGTLLWYHRRRLNVGDELVAENVMLVDGSRPHPGDVIPNCPACGQCVLTGLRQGV